MPNQLIAIGFTALDRIAVAVVIGIAITGAWLLVRQQERFRVATGIARMLRLVILVLAITSVVILILRTAVMADVPPLEVWPYITRVLLHSDFGVLWIIRMLTLLAMIVILIGLRQKPSTLRFTLIAGCGTLIALLISSSSHAAENGTITLANAVNWLHITAGCLWGGTVAAYVILVLPLLLRDPDVRPMIAATALRLSSLAGFALALVLITGILNAVQHIPRLSDLWTSSYGLTLTVKVAIVTVMAGIGALNRFFVVPAIQRWAQTSNTGQGNGANPAWRFYNLLRIDTFVFAMIIICAAVLGMQSPPYHGNSASRTFVPLTASTTMTG